MPVEIFNARLIEFLRDRFTAWDMRSLLEGHLPGSQELVQELPDPSVGTARYAAEVVAALARRGLIGQGFFTLLSEKRPLFTERVDEIERLWRQGPEAQADSPVGALAVTIRSAPIWEVVADGEPIEPAQQALLTFLTRALPDNEVLRPRWWDEGFFGRTAEHLGQICAGHVVPLSALEATLLCGVPLLVRLGRLRVIEALRNDEASIVAAYRSFDNTPLPRRLRREVKKRPADIRDLVTDWLWVRFLAQGHDSNGVPVVCRALQDVLDHAQIELFSSRIVAPLMSSFDHGLGSLRLEGWQEVPVMGRFLSRRRERVPQGRLAHLLALAARMAIDVSTLSDIVIEHAISRDAVTPEALHAVLTSPQAWDEQHQDEEQQRIFRATCSHHAVDQAVRDHIEVTDQFLRQLHIRRARGVLTLPEAGLPRKLSHKGLTPEQHRDGPAYTASLRLRLMDDEIRALLMGERLYGSPELAIRELYQNALDACRLRRERRVYLGEDTSRTYNKARLRSWSPLIRFVHGQDEERRPYLECHDNGVGMGKQQLIECFALAGRRFVDTDEHHAEQRRWVEAGSAAAFHPNSQFGIGVFSYFMLATEVEVHTRRMSGTGALEEGVQTVITGNGKLFRVRPSDRLDDAGTVIRLYLHPKLARGSSRVSALKTLKSLLWVAEFPVKVIDGHNQKTWAAGELTRKQPTAKKRAPTHPKINRVPFQCPDVSEIWWMPTSEGRLLSDGLYTEKKQAWFIIDLRGEMKPTMSVDRKKILHVNKRDKLLERLRASLEVFRSPPAWLDLEWLWEFYVQKPQWGRRILDILVEEDAHLPVSSSAREGTPQRRPLSLRTLGCFPADRDLIPLMTGAHSNSTLTLPWPLAMARAGWLRRAGLSERSDEQPPVTPTWEQWTSGLSQLCKLKRVRRAEVVTVAAKKKQQLHILAQNLAEFSPVLGFHEEYDGEFEGLSSEAPELLMRPSDHILIGTASDWRELAFLLMHHAVKANVPLSVSLERAVTLRTYTQQPLPEPPPTLLENDRVLSTDLLIVSRSLGKPEHDPSKPRSELISGLRFGLPIHTQPKSPQRLHSDLVPPDVPVAHLVASAAACKQPLRRVVERFHQLAPLLGLDVPEPERLEADGLELDETPSSEDWVLLSRRLNGQRPWLSGTVSVGHVLRASSQLKQSPTQLLDRLASLAPALGLKLPELDAPLPPLTAAAEVILSRDLDGTSPWLGTRVRLGHLLAAADKLQRSLAAVIDEIQPWVVPLRLRLPPRLFSTELDDEDLHELLSVHMDGAFPWMGRVSPRDLVRRAALLRTSPREIYERLLPLSEAAELTLPLPTDPVLELPALTEADLTLLHRRSRSEVRWHTRITAADVMAAATEERSPREVTRRLELLAPHAELTLPFQASDWPDPLDDVHRALLSRDADKLAPWRSTIDARHVLRVAVVSEQRPPALRGALHALQAVVSLGHTRAHLQRFPERVLDEHDVVLFGPKGARGKIVAGALLSYSLSRHLSLPEIVRRFQEFALALPGLQLPSIDTEHLPSREADTLDLALASRRLDGAKPWLTDRLPVDHLDNLWRIRGDLPPDLPQRLALLEALGLTLP